jgi:tetratricopeptide (TPR) repeat protein
MPKRPRSHQLESESRRQFASLLPSRWIWREANPDYGIDGQVEVFDQTNNATGLMFLVQLKATETPNLDEALSVQFKVDTLAYYRQLDLPVMIVLFCAPTRVFFWKWAHEVDTYYAERGQEYFTVRMSKDAIWVPETPSLVERDLREFRGLRAPNIRLPQTFSLVVKEKQFRGVPTAIVESALMEAACVDSDLVCLSKENPPGAHPMIFIEGDKVVVSLSGLTSLTFHTQAYPTEFVSTKLPHDILTSVALVFDRAGHSNIAAQIACRHLDKSTFLGTPRIFFAVLQAIAKGRRLTDGLRLAEAFLQPKLLLLAQVFMVPALMSGATSLSTSEREYLRQLMKLAIERFEAAGQMQQAATAHYNLGNHLRAQRGPHDKAALRHYRLASKRDPVYSQRHYFWREVGGVLFGLGRFRYSANAYEKAIRLGGGNACKALRADALMFAGRYSEAHELFRKYLESESGADAEWRLKSFALDGITKLLGVEKQQRTPRDAVRLADVKELRPEDKEASLYKALRKDALCALAWFNLGVDSHARAKPDDAFVAFLLAGLIGRTDPEAWADALLLSLQSSKYQLLVAAIAVTAYEINGQRFLDAVRKLAERQPPEFPSDELLDAIWKVVSSVDRPKGKFEIRVLGEGATFQSLEFGPGSTLQVKPTDSGPEAGGGPKSPT